MIFLNLILLLIYSCNTVDYKKQNKNQLKYQKSIIINYLQKGKNLKAFEFLRQISHIKDDDIYTLSGMVYMGIGNARKANNYFKKVYINKKDISSALNYSCSLITLNEIDKASKILSDISKNIKNDNLYNSQIYHNIGFLNEKKGLYLKASRFYKKAILENPNQYISMIKLAKIYAKFKNYQDMLNLSYKAHNNCKLCYDPVFLISKYYVSMGNIISAKNIMKNYMKKNISNINLKKARNFLNTL